ncbi:MAG: glycosyltransferase [Planctomycetota bacterium]
MRVDFVITELFVGGAERCLTELAIGLADAGDEVRVFSIGSLPTGEQRLLVERLEQRGIALTSANVDRWTGTLRAFRKLKQWFAESPPDICQSFLYHANVIGAWAAKSAGVPIRVGGVRVAESNRIRCALERVAVRQMDSVICVSDGVRRFAHRELHATDNQLAVIPNGVDVHRFSAARPADWTTLEWPADSIVALFVGRLHPQKGIERIQSHIDSIVPPNTKRRLLIVGDGPLQQEIDDWADAVGAERVRRIGWQADVGPLMKGCRLLLLPSHYEGMPNVALEAMAAGRPVVCSRVEGVEELLKHRLKEQTFASEDVGAMKNLIETFLLDEVWSEQIGTENCERVTREFSVEAMIDAYRAHYRELLIRTGG